MQIKVLGCSGGIGGHLRTTAFLVDEDILIDAGTGVGDLSIEALLKIDHIFVTHSHLDHITSIPFLLDTAMGLKSSPITVYASAETLAILKEHIFNWKVWPDFNTIPSQDLPLLRYQEIALGQTINLQGRKITSLPANHVVPAVGYQIDSGNESLVFSGDTTSCDAFWEVVNKISNLRYIILETAFSDGEIALARLSKHLCPILLEEELGKLTQHAEIFVTHLKPGEDALIMQQINASGLTVKPLELMHAQIFRL